MFNSSYTLPLCELTPTKYSDEKLKEELREYLSKKLLRTMVEVKNLLAGARLTFGDVKKLNADNQVDCFVGNFIAEKYTEQGHLGAFLTGGR